MKTGPAGNGDPTDATLRVGYILKMFPRLSETFILNELLELERQGVEASVFSLMHPGDGRFHGRLAELRLTTEYFPKERLDRYWDLAWERANGSAPSFDRWGEAAAFLRRHSIPGDLDLLLRAVVIAARAREKGIQHIHAHFATVSTRVAAVVNVLTGIPFSFTAHAKDIFRNTVNRKLFADLVDRAAFAITVSDFNREYILAETPGVDAGKIIRLYNGIDLDFFHPDLAARTTGIPHILSVGRLVPKKGFEHLLRALAICKREDMEFRATIVGGGEQMPLLTSLRDRLGLANEVTLTGALPQEDVRRLCAEATVVTLACVPDPDGNMDALPTSLLEALALDRPIVSTRLTGVPEIVGNDAGLLVDPGDEAELARALRSVCDRVRSGAFAPGTARARAEGLFDLGRNVGTLKGLFTRSAFGEQVREAV